MGIGYESRPTVSNQCVWYIIVCPPAYWQVVDVTPRGLCATWPEEQHRLISRNGMLGSFSVQEQDAACLHVHCKLKIAQVVERD